MSTEYNPAKEPFKTVTIKIPESKQQKMKEWFESSGHTRYQVNDVMPIFESMLQHETWYGQDCEVDWVMTLSIEHLIKIGAITELGPRTEGPDAHPDYRIK